jgi:hypothetical protein
MATKINISDGGAVGPAATELPDGLPISTAQAMTHVTVLQSMGSGKLLTKRIYRGQDGSIQKKDYGNAYKFFCRRHAVSGIEELGTLLSELEQDRSLCIIRGEPLPEIDLSQPVRRLINKSGGGRSLLP